MGLVNDDGAFGGHPRMGWTRKVGLSLGVVISQVSGLVLKFKVLISVIETSLVDTTSEEFTLMFK